MALSCYLTGRTDVLAKGAWKHRHETVALSSTEPRDRLVSFRAQGPWADCIRRVAAIASSLAVVRCDAIAPSNRQASARGITPRAATT